jgi:hypothetical protein
VAEKRVRVMELKVYQLVFGIDSLEVLLSLKEILVPVIEFL